MPKIPVPAAGFWFAAPNMDLLAVDAPNPPKPLDPEGWPESTLLLPNRLPPLVLPVAVEVVPSAAAAGGAPKASLAAMAGPKTW